MIQYCIEMSDLFVDCNGFDLSDALSLIIVDLRKGYFKQVGAAKVGDKMILIDLNSSVGGFVMELVPFQNLGDNV